jgi:uncharacterized protein YqeY
MALKEQIQSDLTASMKARDQIRTDALRMLRAAIQRYEVDRTDAKHPQHGQPIGDGDYITVLQREIKQRHDSIEAFRKGSREDLAAKEEAEIKVLSVYLPQQLTKEQIVEHVRRLVEAYGRDFKAVMPKAAQELRGRGDGRLVNEVVRELTQ